MNPKEIAQVAIDKKQLRSPVMETNMNPVLKKGESLESIGSRLPLPKETSGY